MWPAAAVDGQMWCSLGRNGIISTTQCIMKEHICRFTVAQKGTLMQLSYSGSPLTVVVGGVVPLQELCCSSRQQDDEAAPWYIYVGNLTTKDWIHNGQYVVGSVGDGFWALHLAMAGSWWWCHVMGAYYAEVVVGCMVMITAAGSIDWVCGPGVVLLRCGSRSRAQPRRLRFSGGPRPSLGRDNRRNIIAGKFTICNYFSHKYFELVLPTSK